MFHNPELQKAQSDLDQARFDLTLAIVATERSGNDAAIRPVQGSRPARTERARPASLTHAANLAPWRNRQRLPLQARRQLNGSHMTTHTITVTSDELGDIIHALYYQAAERRNLANTCGDIALLAKQRTDFQAEAERLDSLASKLARI